MRLPRSTSDGHSAALPNSSGEANMRAGSVVPRWVGARAAKGNGL